MAVNIFPPACGGLPLAALAEGAERGAQLLRVVRVVVDDADSVRPRADELHAPREAAERGERGRERRARGAERERHPAGEERVLRVVQAGQREARARLEKSIESGAALDKLAAMVRAQGGDPAAVYDTSLLPQAPVVRTVKAPCDGYIAAMEAKDIGLVSMHLGGGRATKEDVIDLSVGVVLAAKDGAYLHTGDTLATIHAKTEADAAAAEEELLKCYTFSDEAPVRPPFIRGVVT